MIANKAQTLLHKLQSSGSLKYKRFLGSPLRYAGGKSLAVGYIAELLPPKIKRLVSPFIGGGAVEIAIAQEMEIEVIAYDIFDILTNYWNIQINQPKSLHKRLVAMRPNRRTFKSVKKRLSAHWNKEQKLNRWDLAAHYYFNSNTSYGPHFLGWPSDIYLNEKRYTKTLNKVKSFKADTLSVECATFQQSISRHKKDFLYCDPPYYLDDGKMFVGMYPHRNFPIHHNGFHHDQLRDLLLSHKGGFVLSYNDCDIIRDWYSDCQISEPTWQYTFGQGDVRIGSNRIKNNGGSHVKKSHELLIYKPPQANKRKMRD